MWPAAGVGQSTYQISSGVMGHVSADLSLLIFAVGLLVLACNVRVEVVIQRVGVHQPLVDLLLDLAVLADAAVAERHL